MSFRVLICGSREWPDANVVQERLARLPLKSQLIVGDAKGVDLLVRDIAWWWSMPVQVFRADWEKHGKRAGILRNLEMLDEKPDLVIAFWDGQSPGTKHVIEQAEKRSLPLEVIRQSP